MMEELPQGWQLATLGEVCDKPQYGWTTKSEVGEGLPYLRTTDISSGSVNWEEVPVCVEEPENVDKYLLKDGDIVVSRAGSVGISHLMRHPPPSVFASYLIRIRPRPEMANSYVAHFLNSPSYWKAISDAKTGIAIPNVNARRLAAIQISVPPALEQARIVAALEEHFSRLDAVDSALETAKSRSAHFLECALQVAIRQYPTEESSFASFLTQKLCNGRSVPTANGGGLPVLRLTCLQRGLVNTNETKLGDFGGVDHEKYRIEPDNFLISRGNGSIRLVGIGGLVPAHAPPVAFPDTLIRARVDYRRLRPEFLRLIWNSKIVRRQLEAQARTTAGIYKVNQTMISKVSFPTPSPEDQDRLVQELDQVRKVVSGLDTGVSLAQERSQSLRRSILADAFSGQLVPQDPDDEPASVLLEGIVASRRPS